MDNFRRRALSPVRSSATALAFLLAASPQFAFSQTASAQSATDKSADEGGQLETITVTAQKRSENLQKVPITVSAFSPLALSNAGAGNTKDLQTVVPGMVFTQNQSLGNIYLRGVGANIGTIGQESPVAFYVDGVYLAQPSSFIMGFNNIEQVAVLKGPQGTLFGRNATGGVVQITTKDPSQNPVTEFDVGYGNWKTLSGHLYVAQPVTSDLAVSIALMGTDEAEGYGYNVSLKRRIFQQRQYGGQNKWVWKPTGADRVTLDLLAVKNTGWIGSTTGVFPGSLAEDGTTRFISDWTVADGTPTDGQNSQKLESLKYEHDFGWAKLVNIAAAHQLSERFTVAVVGIPFGSGKATIASYDNSAHTYTDELQLQSATNAPIQWIIGAFYMFDRTNVGVNASKDTKLVQAQTFKQDTNSYSVFAQATKAVLSGTRLTAGLRYTKDYKDVSGSLQNLGAPLMTTAQIAAAASPAWSPSKHWAKVTYRVSVDHDITSNILAYVTYNTGFKSGIYSGSNVANPPANPETLRALEGGLKTELFDRRLRFNVSGFRYWYDNLQLRATLPNQITTLTLNAARASIRGVDIDFEARPVSQLTISGGAEFLHARYAAYPNGICSSPKTTNGVVTGGVTSTPCNLSGRQLIRAPNFTGNIGFAYVVPLAATRDIKFAANEQYNSGFGWDPDNRLRMAAYHMVSASLTYEWKSGSRYITAWGKNLANVDLYSTATAASTDQYAPGVPRTYGVTIGARI